MILDIRDLLVRKSHPSLYEKFKTSLNVYIIVLVYLITTILIILEVDERVFHDHKTCPHLCLFVIIACEVGI